MVLLAPRSDIRGDVSLEQMSLRSECRPIPNDEIGEDRRFTEKDRSTEDEDKAT